MTVSAHDIVLDDNLRLDGVHTQAAMAGSARATMGGVHIQSIAMSAGKTLQLVATRDGDTIKGCFLGSQVDALAALRDAGESFTLVHHLGTFRVWIPPAGISVEQVFDFSDPDGDSWYIGTITLITVA
jgi:hypothetical protein